VLVITLTIGEMTQKMETQRRVARPMGNEVFGVIDMFLGIPDCDAAGNPTKYNRIDTFNREELLKLGKRKLKLHLSLSKYNTLITFIEAEVNSARIKQQWFDPQKEKEPYFQLDHYISYLRNDFSTALFAKIREAGNWIEVFAAIDIDIPMQTGAHVTTTIEQKKNFVSKASFNLTCQYLHGFKRKTLFLSDEQKIIFIEQMNTKRPNPLSVLKNDDKDREAFDQTNYSAENNYFDFLMNYKDHLKNKNTLPNFCVGLTTYGPEIYDKVKNLKPEFDTITDYAAKLQFFLKHDLSLECRTYPTTADPENQKLPENKLSIEPETPQQIAEYNHEFFQWFIKKHKLGIKHQIQNYRYRIENGANTIPLTKKLIKDIEKKYDDDKKSLLPEDFKRYSLGYDQSIYGDIERSYFDNPKLLNTISYFCYGYNDERFKRFLEIELKKLEAVDLKAPDEEGSPFENLDKMVWAYAGFVDECQVDFPQDIKDDRNDRIYALYSKMFGLEMYDVAHRAFQEVKKLALNPNPNADKTIAYYLNKTNLLIEKVDEQVEKFGLNLASSFVRFNSYHETIGWLRKFNSELKSFLNIQSITSPNETNNDLPSENKDNQNSENIELKDIQKPGDKKKPKPFKDFFNAGIDEMTILVIKEAIKDYKGKKMAIAINLLQTNFKIISIINQRRKEFVWSLTEIEPEAGEMSNLNKNFTQSSDDMKVVSPEDGDYISIKEIIQKLLPQKSC
jgi:hypothetical protein